MEKLNHNCCFIAPESVPQWLQILEKHGFDTSPPHVPHKLLDRLVGELLEPECIQPTFLCDHPTAMSPLAKAYYDRPGISQRFELFVNGKELCNAYNELNDPQEQQSRFAGQDLVRPFPDARCSVSSMNITVVRSL